LRLRSTATDWHDGQISCSRENAVKEIVAVIVDGDSEKMKAVIARSESDEAIQAVPTKQILDCFASLAMTGWATRRRRKM
jgi:hypothetical protein